LKKFLICFLFLSASLFAAAQEMDLLDINKDDLDSLFDGTESAQQAEQSQEQIPDGQQTSILKDIRKRGIEFIASYSFKGAINPGWDMYPWEFDGSEQFSWALGINMEGSMTVNAQISETFRVFSVLSFNIPSAAVLSLGDFFFDYNILETVFLRAGKFEQGWGISPNYNFTNLLIRVPAEAEGRNQRSGPSYMMKFDIPIGVGGLQLLMMTRVDVAGGVVPWREDFGYGGKFNLAFSWADFNLGFYWQEGMASRGFLSAKTSLWKADFYNEWLFAVNTHTDNSFEFAFNFGFIKSFFNGRFDVNFEYFYNNEGINYYYREETDFREKGESRFPRGSNFALNLLCRFNVKMSPRLFTGLRYSITENSVSLIPGIKLTVLPNLEVYFAVPMALGSKDGLYYKESVNVREQLRPLSFLLYITFSGNVRASHYY